MFHSLGREQYPRTTLFKWFLLAFLAGNVNAGGYMACHRFVTHVTGFATLFGIDMAHGEFRTAIGILSVPFYFLIGAMISALFVDAAAARGRAPRYGTVMGIEAALLLAAAMGGYYQLFGVFGVLQLEQDYLLLVLLCTAMGLQNAAISSASGAVMRTTHLTGITTDLGIGLVRLAFGRMGKKQRSTELNKVVLRVGSIMAFAAGCAVGAMLFLQVEYLGFLLPSVIAIYTASVAWRTARRQRAGAAVGAAGGADDVQAS